MYCLAVPERTGVIDIDPRTGVTDINPLGYVTSFICFNAQTFKKVFKVNASYSYYMLGLRILTYLTNNQLEEDKKENNFLAES